MEVFIVFVLEAVSTIISPTTTSDRYLVWDLIEGGALNDFYDEIP